MSKKSGARRCAARFSSLTTIESARTLPSQLRPSVLVDAESAVVVLELGAERCDDHVFDGEAHVRVDLVDAPGACCEWLRGGGAHVCSFVALRTAVHLCEEASTESDRGPFSILMYMSETLRAAPDSDQHAAGLELPLIEASPVERADAARNRTRILCAAERLFAERGAGCVSMDEVAEAAGVGKGTLFRRFGSRAALARCAAQRARARVSGRASSAARRRSVPAPRHSSA